MPHAQPHAHAHAHTGSATEKPLLRRSEPERSLLEVGATAESLPRGSETERSLQGGAAERLPCV